MVVALRLLGREADAQPYLTSLREHGTVKDRNGSAGAIYAADRDGLTTGFWKRWAQNQKEQPWVYYRRPHLGATCWYIFAELGWNPYWGERVRAVE